MNDGRGVRVGGGVGRGASEPPLVGSGARVGAVEGPCVPAGSGVGVSSGASKATGAVQPVPRWTTIRALSLGRPLVVSDLGWFRIRWRQTPLAYRTRVRSETTRFATG